MPRSARFVLPGWPVHLVQRGINRANCFFGEKDYLAYLDYLAKYSEQCGCSVHAYCLMTNHVHLLVTPHRGDACAALMKNVGQCYAQRMNIRLDRKGPLWEGRFRSAVVNSHRHLLACYRYIELNPVRAGLVPRPEHYRWSSYLFNAFGHSSPVLVPQEIYKQLGASTDERATVYRELFEQPMEPEMLEEIRTATSGGFVMGAARRRRGRPRRLLVGM